MELLNEKYYTTEEYWSLSEELHAELTDLQSYTFNNIVKATTYPKLAIDFKRFQ